MIYSYKFKRNIHGVVFKSPLKDKIKSSMYINFDESQNTKTKSNSGFMLTGNSYDVIWEFSQYSWNLFTILFIWKFIENFYLDNFHI